MSDPYSKIVNSDGQLLNYENFRELEIDLPEIYKLAEQMYGMIWELASTVADYQLRDWQDGTTAVSPVKEVRENWMRGLHEVSPGREAES